MNTFSAEKISFIYDHEQDRIDLLFHDDLKQQMIGILTRALLKNVIQRIPGWFTELNQSAQSNEHKQAIAELNYASAQQEVHAEKENLEVQHNTTRFLISSLNITKPVNSESLILTFMDRAERHQVKLSLTEAQFHKIISTMLQTGKNWDLTAPWDTTDISAETAAINLSKHLH
ncbi:MAG: hypothetical protein HQL46_01320 [Gammaproteobacteria bacterium]|nr:hypothetical protein [Gammaproteobacteria bacterium]